MFAKIRYYFYLMNGIYPFFKGFKNFVSVIYKHKRNLYPINAVLHDGRTVLLHNREEFRFASMGLVNRYSENEDLLVINQPPLFNNIKFYGAVKNGDFFSAWYEKSYDFFIFKNNIVIDVGANIAESSIYFILKGARKVIGIEPFPINFEAAKKNVIENDLAEKIELLNVVCSTKEGYIKLDPIQKGTRSIVKEKQDGINIPTISISKIIKKFGVTNALLKMDCEGCEYENLLNTPCNDLKKFRQMVIEYHHGYQNLKEKLENCGFKLKITAPILDSTNNQFFGYIYATLNEPG